MFPTSSRKPLLRTNSERPAMRNWPLFGFLFGLVFFFYIVYIYQAQSTEFDILKDQFDSQIQLAKNLKSELIDAKAELEKLKSQQTALTTERDALSTKQSDCTSALRSCSLKSENFQAQKTKTDEFMKEKDQQIEVLQKNVTESSALRSLLTAQETISQQLNQTVILLQNELAALKGSKPAADLPSVAQSTPTTSTTTTSAPVPAEAPNVAIAPKDLEAKAEEYVAKEGAKAEPVKEEEEEVLKEVGDAVKDAAEQNDIAKDAVVAEPLKDDEAKKEEVEEEKKEEDAEVPKVKGGDYEEKADV